MRLLFVRIIPVRFCFVKELVPYMGEGYVIVITNIARKKSKLGFFVGDEKVGFSEVPRSRTPVHQR